MILSAGELVGVGQEVDQHLTQQRRVTHGPRQVGDAHLDFASRLLLAQLIEYVVSHGSDVHLLGV
jgi:hypothetical protein